MRWWVRFQLGISLMPLVNFALLCISASPVIGKFVGCRAILAAALLVPVVLVGIAAVGWAMDAGRWSQRLDRELGGRCETTWVRLFAQLDRIENTDRPTRLLKDIQALLVKHGTSCECQWCGDSRDVMRRIEEEIERGTREIHRHET